MNVELPCIRKLLGDEKFGEAGAKVLAAYIKSYVNDTHEVLELVTQYVTKEKLGVDVVARFPKMVEKSEGFSCELVKELLKGICDEDMQSVCPLHSKSTVTKVLARVRSVKVFKNRYLVVEFADGKTFEESLDKLVTQRGVSMKTFKAWWAANYKEVLDFLKTKDIDEAYELFKELIDRAEFVNVPDEVDEAKEFIVDLISHYKLHKKKGVRNIYFDDKVVYIPNTLIKSFMDITDSDFSLRKLRVLLDDILAGNSEVEWIDGRPVRVWRFIREAVEVLLKKRGIKFEDLIVDDMDVLEVG